MISPFEKRTPKSEEMIPGNANDQKCREGLFPRLRRSTKENLIKYRRHGALDSSRSRAI
jgi:hypothetical protein